jgi:hypothetical protein
VRYRFFATAASSILFDLVSGFHDRAVSYVGPMIELVKDSERLLAATRL